MAFLASMALGALALWKMQTGMPALAGLIEPIYWVLGAISVIVTWRWFRARTHTDRRGEDRRQSDRRD